jgi:hypothetical protein
MPHPNSLANLKNFPPGVSGYRTPRGYRMVLRTCRINSLEMADTLISCARLKIPTRHGRRASRPPSLFLTALGASRRSICSSMGQSVSRRSR